MIPSRNLIEPICTIKRGKAPSQTVDMTEFDKAIDAKANQTIIDDIDIEQIDGGAFNEEDLEDGFDILDDM